MKWISKHLPQISDLNSLNFRLICFRWTSAPADAIEPRWRYAAVRNHFSFYGTLLMSSLLLCDMIWGACCNLTKHSNIKLKTLTDWKTFQSRFNVFRFWNIVRSRDETGWEVSVLFLWFLLSFQNISLCLLSVTTRSSQDTNDKAMPLLANVTHKKLVTSFMNAFTESFNYIL